MEKSHYINEIKNNLIGLDRAILKYLSEYIKYIRFKVQVDPTLEILSDNEFYQKVKTGINEIERGEYFNWDDIK